MRHTASRPRHRAPSPGPMGILWQSPGPHWQHRRARARQRIGAIARARASGSERSHALLARCRRGAARCFTGRQAATADRNSGGPPGCCCRRGATLSCEQADRSCNRPALQTGHSIVKTTRHFVMIMMPRLFRHDMTIARARSRGRPAVDEAPHAFFMDATRLRRPSQRAAGRRSPSPPGLQGRYDMI